MRALSLVIIGASLFLSACGSAGLGTSQKLDIKLGGKDSTLTVKSATVNYSSMFSTSPGKPEIQTFVHTIYIANYEMDTSDPGWMQKPLTAPDQMRVDLQLTGEAGTTIDSPFKVATYGPKADAVKGVFNGARSIRIITVANGKETRTDFDTGFGGEKVSGEVKITSVTADTVSGEVNLTEGDKSIKGSFTAKLPKKKT